MKLFEEIKSKINILEYARTHLNIPVMKSGDRWKSFKPGAKAKTSLAFKDRSFIDYTLNESGSVIDLCALARHNGDIMDAARELAELYRIKDTRSPEKIKAIKDAHQEALAFHANISPEVREYVNGRGITNETIERFKIGSNGNSVTVPSFRNKKIVTWQSRSISDKTFYIKKNTEAWFLGFIDRESPVVICEGMFDALTVDQCGYCSMGLRGLNLNDDYIDILKHHKHGVILCLDNDQSGAVGTKKAIRNLLGSGIRFRICVQKDGKDINDYLQEKGEIKTLIESAVDISEYLVKIAKNIVDIKEAFSMVYDENIIDDMTLFAQNDKRFEKKAVIEAIRFARKPPSEKKIKELVLKNHEIINHPKLGFYEYNGSIWESKEKVEIKKIVQKLLKRFETNKLASQVLGLIEGETANGIEFNKTNVFNLKDVAVDLDTLKIRDHCSADLMTFTTNYKYNPEQSIKEWLSFLSTIMDGNKDKIRLIRQMFAYCLFNENTLTKAFFLVGTGRNGKSVLLKVLKKLMGSKNITGKNVDQLKNQFTRMDLMHSMVNIADDGNVNFKGFEELFKSIVSGSLIDGAKKGKNAVEFTPRTKLIFASNSNPKTDDHTNGFYRRICIISFNQTFNLNPTGRHLKEDPLMLKKLKKEIPGILNWVLEEYKVLKKEMTFIETKENQAIMMELKRENNTIEQFLETLFVKKQYIGELYTAYKLWFSKNMGRRDDYLSQYAFSLEMRNVKSWGKGRDVKYESKKLEVFYVKEKSE